MCKCGPFDVLRIRLLLTACLKDSRDETKSCYFLYECLDLKVKQTSM